MLKRLGLTHKVVYYTKGVFDTLPIIFDVAFSQQ